MKIKHIALVPAGHFEVRTVVFNFINKLTRDSTGILAEKPRGLS